jgi:hypothetical protein
MVQIIHQHHQHQKVVHQNLEVGVVRMIGVIRVLGYIHLLLEEIVQVNMLSLLNIHHLIHL